jgi:hypothetical protein
LYDSFSNREKTVVAASAVSSLIRSLSGIKLTAEISKAPRMCHIGSWWRAQPLLWEMGKEDCPTLSLEYKIAKKVTAEER